MTDNPIVDELAEALYKLEAEKWERRACKWADLADMRRQALREKVHDVILAAMNAGYVLTRIDEKGRISTIPPPGEKK